MYFNRDFNEEVFKVINIVCIKDFTICILNMEKFFLIISW